MDIEQQRKRLIGRAYALKSQMAMSDDDFEQLKKDSTGVISIRLMDLMHLKAFVAAIARLQTSKELPATVRRLSDGQYRKIIKLAKYILKWNDAQLMKFIEGKAGKRNISWLTAREAYNITEALSAMIERSTSNGVKSKYKNTTRHRKVSE
jgi:hypothetical protein